MRITMPYYRGVQNFGISLVLLCCITGCANPERPALVLYADPLPTALESDVFPLNGGHWPQYVVGQDGGYSVNLGDGRILWLFGDTFVGYSPDRADILRFKEQLADRQVGRCNTAAISDIPQHGKSRFLGSHKAEPFELHYWAPLNGLINGEPIAAQAIPYVEGESFDAGYRLWPGGGVRTGDWIYVFFGIINIENPNVHARYSLARSHISDPLRFERVLDPTGRPLVLPFGEVVEGAIYRGPVEFGSSPWVEGGYIYTFVTYHLHRTQWRCLENEKRIEIGWAAHLARAPVEEINNPDAWELSYGRGEWGKVPRLAVSFFELQGHSVSVHKNPYLGKWVAAYAPLAVPSVNDSLEVIVCVADEPDGPWSNAVEIFRAPEAPMPEYTPLFGDSHPESNMYIAVLHPWSSFDGGRTMLLTFNDSRRGNVYAAWVDLSRLRFREYSP